MNGGAWPPGLNWRRLRDAARPVLDDPGLDPLVERLAAVLATRLDVVDQERAGRTEAQRRRLRCVLVTRMAMRYLAAVTRMSAEDRSGRPLPLLLLAAACRLRSQYASDIR